MTTNDKWHPATLVLAAGGSLAEAAAAAGVTKRTVQRWKADEPGFGDLVADLRTEMVDRASGVLLSATSRAAAVLAEIFEDIEVAPQYRQSAAKSVLELAARYRSDLAIEERLRSLELAAGLRKESVL